MAVMLSQAQRAALDAKLASLSAAQMAAVLKYLALYQVPLSAKVVDRVLRRMQ